MSVSLYHQPSLHGVCCGEMGSAGDGGELSANISIVTHFSRAGAWCLVTSAAGLGDTR